MKSEILISVVVPCYNATPFLDELCLRISNSISSKGNYEIILVEDRSPDDTWFKIKELTKNDPHIIGIRFSRNFGQHKAITAGIAKASGQYVVVMDCDLQDRPEDIPHLYEKIINSDCEIILTKKIARNHSMIKNITAKLYRIVFNLLIPKNFFSFSENVGGFSICSRKAIDAFNSLTDTHRHYLNFIAWIGFKKDFLVVKHDKRKHGKSNYNFIQLLSHAFDGITSESDKLLKSTVLFSILILFITILVIFYLIFQKITIGTLPGWSSIVLTTLTSLTINLFFLGVIAAYVGKIFEQVKKRPLYIIDEIASKNEKING